MKFKMVSIMLVALLMITPLYGCRDSGDIKSINDLNSEAKLKDQKIIDLYKKTVDLQKQVKSMQSGSVLNAALTVVNLLKVKDMAGLATRIHPTKGLRFTPYSNISLQNDLVFTSTQILTLLQSNQTHNWGVYDGKGTAIQETFLSYYNEFVYDVDFANPQTIGNNVVIGKGNMTNNIVQAYPNATFVEFHFSGFNSQYGGADWKSLRLVFEKVGTTWYLVGIVHDQWTI